MHKKAKQTRCTLFVLHFLRVALKKKEKKKKKNTPGTGILLAEEIFKP